MIEIIIQGVKENIIIVGLSLFMLIGGTIAAYRKFGLKRVLLGKTSDKRDLVYKRPDGSIEWPETLKTWKIIMTGGMSLLTIFLLLMLLILSFVYAMDIKSTRTNDEILCRAFGTTSPTQEQMNEYYGVGEIDVDGIKIVDKDFIGPLQKGTIRE